MFREWQKLRNLGQGQGLKSGLFGILSSCHCKYHAVTPQMMLFPNRQKHYS